MEPFSIVTAVAAPFPRTNIDTDAIIPVTRMRGVSKDMSDGLFDLWRRDPDGRDNLDFVLNQPKYRNARIIVAAANFGCGSSREAAVWALTYSGIRCVIAPSFGDIFYENAFKNGLLAAIVTESQTDDLLKYLESQDCILTVNLASKMITRDQYPAIPFTISDSHRRAMMEGHDEIDTSLTYEPALTAFQERDRQRRPWVYELEAVPARRTKKDTPRTRSLPLIK